MWALSFLSFDWISIFIYTFLLLLFALTCSPVHSRSLIHRFAHSSRSCFRQDLILSLLFLSSYVFDDDGCAVAIAVEFIPSIQVNHLYPSKPIRIFDFAFSTWNFTISNRNECDMIFRPSRLVYMLFDTLFTMIPLARFIDHMHWITFNTFRISKIWKNKYIGHLMEFFFTFALR